MRGKIRGKKISESNGNYKQAKFMVKTKRLKVVEFSLQQHTIIHEIHFIS